MDRERHNKSLQGVLRFALQTTKSEDAPNATNFTEMDEERKTFLENVLKSMTVDVIEELEKAILTLQSETSAVEDKVEAINVIRDYTDHIDFANNFIKIGGSRIVLDCLKCNHPKLRTSAAYVIAELSQNNPFCQQHFLDTDVIQLLLSYTKGEADVASSAMHAISSLVRNFEKGCAKFIELDGLKCILRCLQSPHNNLCVKSCFLLRALSSEFPTVRDKFVKLGAIPRLTSLVDAVSGFDHKIEIVLSALAVLAESPEGKVQLQKTDVYPTLQALYEMNFGKSECEEILADCNAILDCFEDKKSCIQIRVETL